MRERKFRAFLNGEMFKSEEYGMSYFGYYWDVFDSIQQYTGQKDKNGLEIYEYDVMEDNIGTRSVVVWYNAAFRLKKDEHLIPTQGNIKDWGDMKVVGNIYGNP